MKTEWHNYKSGRTGKIVGAYLYFPDHSDEVLAHVYSVADSFRVHFYHACGVVGYGGGLRFATQSEARLHATRQVAKNLGLIEQGDLPL